MQNINTSILQFCLVVEKEDEVVGTLTDGDIRRALLNGADINDPVLQFINKDFVYLYEKDGLDSAEKLMSDRSVSQIPVLSKDKKATSLLIRSYNLTEKYIETPVFLLAGGLGTRLRPLTNDLPKPLIDIEGRPILEHIIIRLSRQGFRNIIISINFKGHLIKNYFGDGAKWGLNIQYIEETKKLGTSGSLSLLNNYKFDDILVMNADLITQINLKHLLDHHNQSDALATICSRTYVHEVPFGALSTCGPRVLHIEEKPIVSKIISMGVYALNKTCLELLEYNEYCDMPELLERIIRNDHLVIHFETDDDWIDIGRLSELERAREQAQKSQS